MKPDQGGWCPSYLPVSLPIQLTKMSVANLRDVYTLHDAEISKLFSIIDECEAEINKHHLEIARLRAQKARVENKIAQYHNDRAPINRLSEEVLFLIFTELTRDESTGIGPILLVCKRWNVMAVNSPILWRRIELSLAGSEAGIERQAQYVKRALSHSRPVPFDMVLRFPTGTKLWESFKSRPIVHPRHKSNQWTTHCLFQSQSTDTDHKGLHDWYLRAFKDATSDNYASVALFGHIDNAIYEFMILFVKEMGQDLARMRKLTLICNQSMFSTWSDDKVLKHPTPLLEELVWYNTGSFRSGSEKSHSVLAYRARKLSKLACNNGSHVSNLVAAGQLRVLHYYLSPFNVTGFPHTGLTQNLTTLYLRFGSSESRAHWLFSSDSESDSESGSNKMEPAWLQRCRHQIKQRQKDFIFPRLDRLSVQGHGPAIWSMHKTYVPSVF